MQIEFIAATDKFHNALILPIWADKTLSKAAQSSDKNFNGLIAKTLEQDNAFTGKHGDLMTLVTEHDNKAQKIILLGLGDKEDLTLLKAEEAGAKLSAHSQAQKLDQMVMDLSDTMGAEFMAGIANGFYMRCYDFDRFKSDKNKKQMQVLFIACGNDTTKAKESYTGMKAVTEGVHFARDLSNQPANMLNPTTYAEELVEVFKPLGVKTKIIDAKALKKMGAGAILAVGQGSTTPPCFVVMEYAGAKTKPTKASGWDTALVGKGITFDTGGYSLKPPGSQIDMKFDMCGSAAVVGTMHAIASRKDKINVVAIVALAENMVADTAYRVNDIITSLSGKTIEILNTDAEGRLVLADAMTYIQDKYTPKRMIDAATLTGAAMVALGTEYGAAYSNNDALFEAGEKAAKVTGEKIWRMPLDEVFDKDMKGKVSDLINAARARWGGSCTAAAFLKQFVADDVEWMHLDIAGTPYSASPSTFAPAGANGYGVRLLCETLENLS